MSIGSAKPTPEDTPLAVKMAVEILCARGDNSGGGGSGAVYVNGQRAHNKRQIRKRDGKVSQKAPRTGRHSRLPGPEAGSGGHGARAPNAGACGIKQRPSCGPRDGMRSVCDRAGPSWSFTAGDAPIRSGPHLTPGERAGGLASASRTLRRLGKSNPARVGGRSQDKPTCIHAYVGRQCWLTRCPHCVWHMSAHCAEACGMWSRSAPELPGLSAASCRNEDVL